MLNKIILFLLNNAIKKITVMSTIIGNPTEARLINVNKYKVNDSK